MANLVYSLHEQNISQFSVLYPGNRNFRKRYNFVLLGEKGRKGKGASGGVICKGTEEVPEENGCCAGEPGWEGPAAKPALIGRGRREKYERPKRV